MRRAPAAPTLARTARAVLASLAAMLALCVLFELPSLALSDPLRPTGEVLALLTLYCASVRFGGAARLLRWLLAPATALLLVYRLDQVIFRSFMDDEPLLYDQAFMLRHLFVLAGDLWSPEVLGGIVVALATAVLAVGLVSSLLGVIARAVASVPTTAPLALAMLWVAAFATPRALGDADEAPALRWLAPEITANVEESLRIHDTVGQSLRRSPYHAYASIHLARKPDVYLFFVESYGRFAIEDRSVQSRMAQRLQRMELRARRAGWHTVSAYSRAPVSGGRSWLAEASVLMGTEVRYEAVFQHLVGQVDGVPNLVGFLAGRGYHTILLAPADRVRPGIEDVNNYRFQRQVRFDELSYEGQRYGWGIVPDQYSLEHTHATVLAHARRPLFFDFHMVSSHAPWERVPRIVDDWRTLGREDDAGASTETPSPDADEVVEEDAAEVVERRLARYLKKGRRFRYMGALEGRYARKYGKAIAYELGVIDRYLPRIPGNALVIVMGDHQPPFVARGTRSFDVPVHVFARDEKLLAEFRSHGFAPGLQLRARVAALRHEGLFSLIVRTLAGCCGMGGPLPEVHPRGVPLVD